MSDTDVKAAEADIQEVATEEKNDNEEEEVVEGDGEKEEDGENEEKSDHEDDDEKKTEVESLREELSKIDVESLEATVPMFDPDSFPPSYKDNNPKEKQAVARCKAFIRHWIHLFHDRRPIFLLPRNEFGVEKIACTSIRPCQLPYKDLLDWQEIANFVAGYLNYDPLKPPEKLPKTMFSPQTVLERQRGHCLEYSTLLCSMLIGSGYDAYVVCGNATREVCNVDLSYTRCPLVDLDQIVYPKHQTKNVNRYTVRPPRLYASEFLLRMSMKEKAKKEARRIEIFKSEERERKLREAPPEDPLFGWRVHSWVMVLAGRRDITNTFFIEPTTGVEHPTNWEEYLGVESLWNHLNYYLNVQQETVAPSEPVTKYVTQRPMRKWPLRYDIGDSRDWEHVFAGQDLHITPPAPEDTKEHRSETEKKCEPNAEHLHFDLPLSWSLPLNLSRDEYDIRYPTGKKTIRYKYAVVEKFAHYLQPDGLIQKLYVYKDLPCTELFYTEEVFAHRADLMEFRFVQVDNGNVIEKFAYGRDDFIRENQYHIATALSMDGKRTMIFERGKRIDELYKREQDHDYMKQYYGPRADRKHYKEIRYGPRGKILEKSVHSKDKPFEVLIERYHRNPSVPAHEDIETVTFSVWKDEIDIKYHVPDHMIICSTRHFTKPPRWWDPTVVLAWSPDLHRSYQSDVFLRPLGELELYQMLMNLMEMESTSRNHARAAEREVRFLLTTRDRELMNPVLVKYYFQADRDPETRLRRLEEKAKEKAARILKRSDILRDYMQPYLDRLDLNKVTNKKQANRIKDDMLFDLRQRFIIQANLMKDEFEVVRGLIETTQLWYQRNFHLTSKEDNDECRAYIMQHMFVAHILQLRLKRFKEYAPVKYSDLFLRLTSDPRLEEFFQK